MSHSSLTDRGPFLIGKRQGAELHWAQMAKGAVGTVLVVLGSVTIMERSSLDDRVEEELYRNLVF